MASLDRLRVEVRKFAASREQLLLAGDADRRAFEQYLHDDVQHHLISLAVAAVTTVAGE